MSKNEGTIESYELGFEAYIANTVSEVSGDVKAWIDQTLSLLSPKGSIIEIGSAHGRDAGYIQSQGFAITPTDATKAFVSALQQKGYPAKSFNIITEPFFAKYDLVFANAVFLHFTREDFKRVLCKIRDGGLVPHGYLSFSLKQGEGEEWTEGKIGHPRFFCYWQTDSLKALLESTGYHIHSLQRSEDQKWLQVIARKSN